MSASELRIVRRYLTAERDSAPAVPERVRAIVALQKVDRLIVAAIIAERSGKRLQRV